MSANNYTAYISINASHRHEFQNTYGSKISANPRGQNNNFEPSKGYYFNKYVSNKMKVPKINIARIDLVYDNTKMLNLLENRGTAIKN